MSADDSFWNSCTPIKVQLRNLGKQSSEFMNVRKIFNRFEMRERNSGDADDVSRKLSRILIDLYTTAGKINPTSPGIDAFATKLKDITEQVDQFLIEYHRQSVEARNNPEYIWRLEDRDVKQKELIDKISDIQIDAEDLAEAGNDGDDVEEITSRALTSPSITTVDRFPTIFDPFSEAITGFVLKNKGRKYTLKGSPLKGSRHAVWRVVQSSTENIFAAKFYTSKADFDREKETLKKLGKSRNTVTLSSVLEENTQEEWGKFNILMLDYCEITLKEYWDATRARKDVSHIRVILTEIISGLEHCHKNGIIHCDIKPENIMRYRPDSTDDCWVLVDFDSAREVGQSADICTLAYTAPELAKAKLNNEKVPASYSLDVWGLGRVLYYLATMFPFWPDTYGEKEILECLAAGKYNIPSDSIDARTHPELLELLEVEPSKRKTLSSFKNSSYITNAHSTKDLKEKVAEARGDMVETVIRQVSMKIDESTDKILNQIESVRRQMLSIESHLMPRIFMLSPYQKEHTFIHDIMHPIGATREKMMMFFFCEAEVPHLAPHEGYKISHPGPFLQKYGKILACALQLLTLALKVAPLPIGQIIPDEVVKSLGKAGDNIKKEIVDYTQKTLNQAIANAQSGITAQDLKTPFKVEEQRTILDEGMQKAFLDEFISKKDPTRKLANLKRCADKNGDIVWLCGNCITRLGDGIMSIDTPDEMEKWKETVKKI